jgi:hypothetical protein
MISIKNKFDYLRQNQLHSMSIDASNWLEIAINQYLPMCSNCFKISLISESSNVLISWSLDDWSIFLKVNLIDKVGYYSELNLKTNENYVLANLDLSQKENWDKVVNLVKEKFPKSN